MNTPVETQAGPEPPEDGRRETQPTSGRVVFQLFVIPLILVSIAVGVSLLFSRLAHVSTTPKDLVADIQQMGVDRWQKAHTLSALLRDTRNDSLKDDALLCRQLAKVLSTETAAAIDDLDRVRLRVFLCRILGEFRIADGLPALTEAAAPSNDSFDSDARLAAIEAIAVLAGNLNAGAVASQPSVTEALLAASREGDHYGISQKQVEIRSAAAFALGVVGGEEAVNRLAAMLADAHSDIRFNAAAGLARHADRRAIPVLLEMLDPENPETPLGGTTSTPRKIKRPLVLLTGIRATERIATQLSPTTIEPLVDALRRLSTNQRVARHVRMDAKETMLRIKSL